MGTEDGMYGWCVWRVPSLGHRVLSSASDFLKEGREELAHARRIHVNPPYGRLTSLGCPPG